MTPFEEWWEVQDYPDKAEEAAKAAWDAANAAKIIMKEPKSARRDGGNMGWRG